MFAQFSLNLNSTTGVGTVSDVWQIGADRTWAIQTRAPGIGTAEITVEASNTREHWMPVGVLDSEGIVWLPLYGHRYARARVSTAEGSALVGDFTVFSSP